MRERERRDRGERERDGGERNVLEVGREEISLKQKFKSGEEPSFLLIKVAIIPHLF